MPDPLVPKPLQSGILLNVDNLHVEFIGAQRTVNAVNGVSFTVQQGEAVGIVGESGSGKSVTALAIMGLVPTPPGRVSSGSVVLDGKELIGLPSRQMEALRGSRMAMVFQDPFSSLDPTMRVGTQIAEPLMLHNGLSRGQARDAVLELLRSVRIPSPELRYNQYPHQFSGGQRQRIMIAIAFACRPALLIADEPTTALDVTVQAQIIALMDDLRRTYRTGVLIITHDLGVVAEMCDRVLVMYAGKVVESGTVEQVLTNPLHPYTRGLLATLPKLSTENGERLQTIPGQPPDLSNLPCGCPFAPRCSSRIEALCSIKAPSVHEHEEAHTVRCFLYES